LVHPKENGPKCPILRKFKAFEYLNAHLVGYKVNLRPHRRWEIDQRAPIRHAPAKSICLPPTLARAWSPSPPTPVSSQASRPTRPALLPPSLTTRPNRPIPDLRFTLTDPPKRMAGKVSLSSEIGQFGLIVWVGGSSFQGGQAETGNARNWISNDQIWLNPASTHPRSPTCVPVWKGCCESRRCKRDTYPESYITKYTSIRR
jgi:hypothetical protein